MRDDHPSYVLERIERELLRLGSMARDQGAVEGRCYYCQRARVRFVPPRHGHLKCEACRASGGQRQLFQDLQ